MTDARTPGLLSALLFLVVALIVAPAVWGADSPSASEPLPTVRIGVAMDGPWELEETLRDLFRQEILVLTEGEFDISFPEDKHLVADWSLAGAERIVDRLLEDPEVDMVVALGLLSSHLFCCRTELDKPVIAPVVIDTDLQGIARSGTGSGIRNLNYLAFPDQIESELKTFRSVVPFDRVTLLLADSIYEAIPELPSRGREAGLRLGLDITYVPVGDSIDEALARMPQDTEAVYLFPLLHLGTEGFQHLLEELIARGLPSFSALGRAEVERGVLTALGRDDFFLRLARRVALNVQRILLGEAPESIPVDFIPRQELVINMATARAIDVSPRWEVLIEADLIADDAESIGRELTLDRAVLEAVDANLDLAAEARAVSVGEQNIARARANRLPQIDVSASGLQIDDDRAEASFGSQPERTLTAGLTVSQLIFSEDVRAAIDIERDVQFSRELGWATLRLDIAFDAALRYLDVLRAETLLDVRRNNLEVTRTNLELARLRRSIGEANPAEVYRWESSIAADRQAVVDARAQWQQAKIALNRLLHRPLEEPFRALEVGLEDPILITGQDRFSGYIETPKHFSVFREFAVEEGLDFAPELKQLDASIAAQQRALVAARRAFRLPTVSAQFSLDELLQDGGVGSNVPTTADDTTWSLALGASLPLFTGGSRRAEVIQAEEELARLELVRESTAERLEQGIRTAIIAARASSTGINLSQQAADAARKTLELTSDSYGRGAVSILDLLDAQNAALNADLNAANAVYDFLGDLMQVQRATNQFDFFVTPTARDAWYRRLDAFFDSSGVERYQVATTGDDGEDSAGEELANPSEERR